jgi:hypothetical protein
MACPPLFATVATAQGRLCPPYGTLHGVVFDILVGSEHRAGLAAVFPDDDRRMACRPAKRRAQMPKPARSVLDGIEHGAMLAKNRDYAP